MKPWEKYQQTDSEDLPTQDQGRKPWERFQTQPSAQAPAPSVQPPDPSFPMGDVMRQSAERGANIGVGENLVRQVAGGAADVTYGVLQRGAEGIGMLPGTDREHWQGFSDFLGQRHQGIEDQLQLEAGQQAHPITSMVGRGVGQTAALPVAGMAQGHILSRIATAGGAGGLAGLFLATDEGESPLKNAAVGAAFGAGLTGLTEPVARIVRKYVNAKGGNFKAEDLGEVLDFARQNKLRIFLDDVSQSRFLRLASNASEEIPITGTTAHRVGQMRDQKRVVEELAQKFQSRVVPDEVPVEKLLGLSESQSARIRNIYEARQMGIPVDPDELKLASLMRGVSKQKEVKNQRWNRVFDIAGEEVVPLNNLRRVAKEQLVDYATRTTKLSRQEVLDAIEDIGRPKGPNPRVAQINRVRQRQGLPPLGDAEQASAGINRILAAARASDSSDPKVISELMSRLDPVEGNLSNVVSNTKASITDILDAQYTGANEIPGKRTSPIFKKLEDAIEADIDSFTRNKGIEGLDEALKSARNASTRFNIEAKKTVLKGLVNESGQEVPERIMQTLRAGKPSQNMLIYRNMDEPGRASVRASVFEDLLKKSVDDNGRFNAATFNREADKLQNTIGVFFKGDDAKEMRGLLRYMKFTEASSRQLQEGGVNFLGRRILTPLQTAVLPAASVAAYAAPGAAVPAIAGTLGFGAGVRFYTQTLMGNRVTRNLLVALGKTTPGTEKFDKIVNRINQVMTRSALSGALQEEGQQEVQPPRRPAQ